MEAGKKRRRRGKRDGEDGRRESRERGEEGMRGNRKRKEKGTHERPSRADSVHYWVEEGYAACAEAAADLFGGKHKAEVQDGLRLGLWNGRHTRLFCAWKRGSVCEDMSRLQLRETYRCSDASTLSGKLHSYVNRESCDQVDTALTKSINITCVP